MVSDICFLKILFENFVWKFFWFFFLKFFSKMFEYFFSLIFVVIIIHCCHHHHPLLLSLSSFVIIKTILNIFFLFEIAVLSCISSSCVYATRKLQKLQSPVGACNLKLFFFVFACSDKQKYRFQMRKVWGNRQYSILARKKLQNYSLRLGTVIFEAFSSRKRDSRRYTHTKKKIFKKNFIKNFQKKFSKKFSKKFFKKI